MNDSSQQHPAGDPHFTRLAARLIGTGAVGVIATSILYAVAGPLAALPGGAVDVEAARAATATSAVWMRAAGLVGMPSDVLLAAGGMMFAATKRGEGAAWAVAGWLTMALAGALFVIVDAMVSLVLPRAAALPDGAAVYAGLRALFDVLFSIGTWTFGLGALAASLRAHWPEYRRRAVLWLMRATALVTLGSGTAYLLGWTAIGPLTGPGVALGSVTLLMVAIAARD